MLSFDLQVSSSGLALFPRGWEVRDGLDFRSRSPLLLTVFSFSIR